MLYDASVYYVKWYELYCVILIILNEVHIILIVNILYKIIFNVKNNIVLQDGELFMRTKKGIYYVNEMLFEFII